MGPGTGYPRSLAVTLCVSASRRACWSLSFPPLKLRPVSGASRLSCVYLGASTRTRVVYKCALMSLRRRKGTRFIKPVYWAFDERLLGNLKKRHFELPQLGFRCVSL